MINQTLRYVLWVFIFFILFILLNSWQNEKILNKNLEVNNVKHNFNQIENNDNEIISRHGINSNAVVVNNTDSIINDSNDISVNEITIDTYLINAKIDLNDGDITYLSLKKYKDQIDTPQTNFEVFNKYNNKHYFAKSGFITDVNSTNSRMNYTCSKTEYKIQENQTELVINLKGQVNDNVYVNKIYTFKNYSYDINVDFYITNLNKTTFYTKFYGLIKKENKTVKNGFFGSRTYEGGALYTEKKIYKKISFDDVLNKTHVFTENGGWISILERYFLSAWIPEITNKYVYTVENNDNYYVIRYINKDNIIVLPNDCMCIKTVLFAGPKTKDDLSKLYAGLDIVIDYGIFWPLSVSMFLLLNKLFSFVNNWGISIIIITVMIKLLFFHLSSMSYRSMGNMKKLQPRLDLLKERYKDDKKEFGHAVMDLYKKEKVNPLSGCLPLLIQIPVFISLYYVLFESIELRHAVFFGWIDDLSSKDSYYILPIIMCGTMFIQQRLNPPIQDDMQRKVMMFLPFIFLLIFLQFPAGLVLYWVVNNILSILQQWIITKQIYDKQN